MVKISEEYSATEKAAAEAWNRRVDDGKISYNARNG